MVATAVKPLLSCEKVTFEYASSLSGTPIIHNLSLRVSPGELIAITGPSGCGKTTLLKLLAGLLKPHSGNITLQGKPITAETEALGFAFQEASLFPWITAIENVAWPLKMRGSPPDNRRKKALELLQQMRLGDYAEFYPHQLSTGMQKRVSIARTLAGGCKVLLLDEPYAALDDDNRDNLRQCLDGLRIRFNICIVLVTHSREEAKLADRVLEVSVH